MPPATRREVRLSASLPDPATHNATSNTIDSSRSATLLMPNMESILENFELFKRKHISQNREIIKANAVAQLRMRELENRIQALEAEKVQKDMDNIALTAQLAKLRHAIGCIHAGWEAIGRGLTLGAGDHLLSQLPPSNRVTVEPNPNAAAVVRGVAKAPEGHIASLPEEHTSARDRQHPLHPLSTQQATSALAPSPEPYHDDWQRHFEAMRAAQSASAGDPHTYYPNVNPISTLDMDGAPSPMGSPELPMELEDAIAAATSRSVSHPWSLSDVGPPPSTTSPNSPAGGDHDLQHSASRQSLRRSGRKSSRRQSGYIPQPGSSQVHSGSQSPEPDSALSTFAPSSDPYLPSETNSETMDGILMYRGGDSSQLHSATPLVDITNANLASATSLYDQTASYLDDDTKLAEASPRKARSASTDVRSTSRLAYDSSVLPPASDVRTPGGRKRKVPAQEAHDPMPTPARLFSATIETTPSATAAMVDADSDPQTGRTRRVRKSINYALPKLNTKMRKPDPSDLVPASTPHRSNGATPASARGMIGSTGNLSDIRKLHEAAALRQSPAERTSHLRSKGSPGGAHVDLLRADDEGGARMADLFEIRQHADQQAQSSNSRSAAKHSFWGADGITDTSDDDSRVTSNADLGELADLEAAMSDLCTADEVHQVDTPRAPQPSMWPSRSAAQMSASSSTDSMASCSSSATSNGTATKRPSLRRKTTTLPSRSRQSSVEQALQADAVQSANSGLAKVTEVSDSSKTQSNEVKTETSSSMKAVTSSTAGSAKTSTPAQSSTDHKKPPERTRTGSAASTSTSTSTSTELGLGRPPSSSSGLAAGMKPKQRPASAGAALAGSRSAGAASNANGGTERPRTFSGTTAANAGITPSAVSNGSTGNVGRAIPSSSNQRASLHSALTNQTKATSGQVTPRIGAKGLPTSTTPSFKESPRFAGTPILRPTLSTSSIASESSGRSSPALSAASTGSTGTQLSTSTRTSLKTSTPSAASQPARAQRPGTAGSATSHSSSVREGSIQRLSASSSSTSLSGARPQPARSMPSLRRATEKTGVTSTPRITVRSSSSTLPAAAGPTSGTSSANPAASIAASKVAKAISSSSASRAKEAASTPMGLGIDFSSMLNDGSAGRELITLTDEIHQVLQSSSSSGDPSSSLSSAGHSSSPTSASKTSSSDDTSTSGASLAKARRTSRRISGMTA